MAKPTRTFSASIGQASTGTAGPDQIETDLDAIFNMFDPSEDGIDTENLCNDAVTDLIIGNRTVDQAIVTAFSNTGVLTNILSWIVKVIKAIQGDVTNWYDTVAYSLTDLKDQIDALVLGELPAGSIDNTQLDTDIKVGSLAALTTTVKTDITSAVNEVKDAQVAETEFLCFCGLRDLRRLT